MTPVVTEVVLSADGFYVNARYGRGECIVQREHAPLPAGTEAPHVPALQNGGEPAGRRSLQLDVWWWDDAAGSGGITTSEFLVRHGVLEGDLSFVESTVFEVCDLDALTDEVVDALPRRGRRVVRALLLRRPRAPGA